MTNLEDSLPRFPTYQKIVSSDGFLFNDSIQKEIGELFDQSKWEDRLLMLALIMQRTELENDPRPSFPKWVKGECAKIEQDFLDYHFPSNRDRDKGIPHPDPYTSALERYSSSKDKINCDNLKKIIGKWNTYSYGDQMGNLTLNLMGVFTNLFPKSMVTPTALGKQCFSSCKSLSQNKLVKEYIDGLYFSLTSFIEGAYNRTVSLKKDNENLYLHKYDFNWSEIIHLVWKIDLVSWWYREYLSDYDPCWKMDITSIPFSIGSFGNTNSYLTECLLPMLFNIYGVDCKDYTKQCYTRMYSWYSGEYHYDEETMNENIEDQWSEIHTHWTEQYGSLK